jgi:hypothetical protein
MDDVTEQKVKAKPEVLPKPTYWPFIMAATLLFIDWGLISTWILSVAGAIGFFIALGGWIKEMLYERTTDERE